MADRAQRFASGIDRHRIAILVGSVVVAFGCGLVASRLRLEADLTALLPASQPSVTDLAALERRAQLFSTVHVVIESPDVARREAAAAALIPRLAALDPALVRQLNTDDGPIARYGWAHRFLFAELADLTAARDTLRARIAGGKLAANPLYVSLADDEPAPDPTLDQVAALEQELADLDRAATAPAPFVSPDRRLQLVSIQTTFAAADHVRGRRLLAAVQRAFAATAAEVGPTVQLGLAGNATFAVHAHDSILDGIGLSLAITVGLCGLALLFYYRSGRLVLAMLWALAVGVVATFAIALGVIGHLDMISAFLTAIVVGNGINAGLILVARYLEEVRAGRDPQAAIAPALAGALRGTLAATTTAAVAYVSLVITDFRGFRHFGAIAGIGMVLTWITTFTVLPAALCVLARRGHIRATRPPAIGAVLRRLVPRRPQVALAIAGTLTAGAAVVTTHYLATDPFTHDWRDLESSTPAIRAYTALDQRLSAALAGRGLLTGAAYQVAIAVDDRADVAPLIARFRAANAAEPPARRWLNDIRGLDDFLPADQPAKLALLAEIRRLIDDPALAATLEPADQARLARLRPPDDVRAIGDADVPRELAWPFVERDGSVGRLLVARGSRLLDPYNVADRQRFAHEVRGVPLPPGALVAGESLVVADIVATMLRDAPKMIGVALAGSVLAVFAMIGLRRHAAVTLVCAFAGITVMIAACALAGLRVHFVDLIALPITIGIGIDYAVNLAARDRQDGERGPHHLIETTGGAVVLCSFTTAVGYGTLMLSANGAIRAFGLAALLGELACVVMALLIAPALLAVLRRRSVAPDPR